MLKVFLRLLEQDVGIFRRYVGMATGYAVLCGLVITALVPLFHHLLAARLQQALPWLLTLAVGTGACWALRRSVEQAGIRVAVSVLQGARQRLGDHVATLPVGWFTPQNTAQLGHVVTQGLMSVAQLPAHVFTPVIAGVVTPLVLALALLVVHWPLGLMALLALPILAGVFSLTGKLSRRADEAFQSNFSDASQRMLEFAQTQSVIRAFNGEGASTRFLEQALDKQQQAGARLIRLSTLASVLNSWAVQAVFAALLVAGAFWLDAQLSGSAGGADIIGVVVALLLVSRFIEPLLEVAGYSEMLQSAGSQLRAISELFAAKPLPETSEPQEPRDASIELQDVHFRYTRQEPEVLKGLSLHIAPCSMTALIGDSGSGKTTLARLISRAFDVTQGRVLVGGIDVREMAPARLSASISQIFQDSYLFAGSIAENIRIGMPEATDAQIMEAAQLAGVTEILGRLPNGVDTLVGEGGARLSGGERQRIAIARALIKDSPIFLIDEATASLDAENQAVIVSTLARLRGKRTLVVIAHQLSTIAMADQIAVLQDGQVLEHGSPEQLRASQGHYAKLLKRREAAVGWQRRSATAD